jgi:hypothetical protein
MTVPYAKKQGPVRHTSRVQQTTASRAAGAGELQQMEMPARFSIQMEIPVDAFDWG